jgi:cytochrome c553
MKSSTIKAALIGLGGLLFMAAAPAADIEAGKAKTIVCQACHGADGNSVNPIWPSLAGQHAKYTLKQLREFKSGRRENVTMVGMVAALTDEDMVNIAAYYETLEIKPNTTFDKSVLQKGQDIYRGGITETSVAACMGCHGPAGTGNGPAAYPSLKSQHPEYIVAQLQTFKNGTRANDAGRMMRNVAKRMSDGEMQAVAAYIAAMN